MKEIMKPSKALPNLSTCTSASRSSSSSSKRLRKWRVHQERLLSNSFSSNRRISEMFLSEMCKCRKTNSMSKPKSSRITSSNSWKSPMIPNYISSYSRLSLDQIPLLTSRSRKTWKLSRPFVRNWTRIKSLSIFRDGSVRCTTRQISKNFIQMILRMMNTTMSKWKLLLKIASTKRGSLSSNLPCLKHLKSQRSSARTKTWLLNTLCWSLTCLWNLPTWWTRTVSSTLWARASFYPLWSSSKDSQFKMAFARDIVKVTNSGAWESTSLWTRSWRTKLNSRKQKRRSLMKLIWRACVNSTRSRSSLPRLIWKV